MLLFKRDGSDNSDNIYRYKIFRKVQGIHKIHNPRLGLSLKSNTSAYSHHLRVGRFLYTEELLDFSEQELHKNLVEL